jgi:hypothetical protein
MSEDKLDVDNKIVKRAFVMANYMVLYNSASEFAMSILIPEDKRNGQSELQTDNPAPKLP